MQVALEARKVKETDLPYGFQKRVSPANTFNLAQ